MLQLFRVFMSFIYLKNNFHDFVQSSRTPSRHSFGFCFRLRQCNGRICHWRNDFHSFHKEYKWPVCQRCCYICLVLENRSFNISETIYNNVTAVTFENITIENVTDQNFTASVENDTVQNNTIENDTFKNVNFENDNFKNAIVENSTFVSFQLQNVAAGYVMHNCYFCALFLSHHQVPTIPSKPLTQNYRWERPF